MPRLHPFRAIRYAPSAGDPAGLLAPPYDVIGESEAAELRRNPRNAVHLVLPEGAAPRRYERAAALFREWRERGVLREEPAPAVFAYRQDFPLGDERLSRWSLFAALELLPFEAGEVLPHEETHAGPKRDRLALTLACRAQLSAVLLSAEDSGGRLRARLGETAQGGAPLFETRTPDGVAHALWRAEDVLAERLCELAARGPLLIADGHHRYETALAVRRRLPDSERARRLLVCVASEADPGLRIDPTHRSLRGPAPRGGWLEALSVAFEPRRLQGAEAPSRAEAAVARAGGGVMACFGPGEPTLLVPRAAALAAAGIEGSLAEIGSAVFDRLVLREMLGRTAQEASRDGELAYHRSPEDAVRAAGPEGAAFLLAPVRPEAVRAAAAQGVRLPPKTTYFAPKIPSGLLFRRI